MTVSRNNAMYSLSSECAGDKDTFYPFHLHWDRLKGRKKKLALLASYKPTWRTDVSFVFPVLICLGVRKSEVVSNRGNKQLHQALPHYKTHKKITKIDNHKKY